MFPLNVLQQVPFLLITPLYIFSMKFYATFALNSTEHPSTCAEGISNPQHILHICTLCMLN